MDDFDRMYETNEARFYAQHYLNQSRDAVSDASGSVRVEDVMAGSASMEDYQPVEEQPKITEDMLQFDGEFVQAAKDVYFMFEDKEFLGTPEEAAKYGIDLMGEFNYNFAGPVGFSGQPGMIAQLGEIMADASPAQANSWLYLMGRYDQLPISKAGTWRFIRGVLSDPTTYLGIGTGGVGIAARAGTKEAAKRTGIAAIKDRIAALSQKAVENPAKSGAIAGAALTAPETAGVQEVKEIAGYEQTPEERALELVTNVGIGAAAGAGLTKGVDALVKMAPQAVRAVSDIIEPEQTLRHGTKSANAESSLKVDKPIGGPRAMGPGVYFDTTGGTQSELRQVSGGTMFELKVPKKVMRDRVPEYLQKVDDLPDDARARLLMVAEKVGEQPTRGESVGNLIARLRANPNISDQDLIDQGFSGLKRKKQQEAVIWDQSVIDSAPRSETKVDE